MRKSLKSLLILLLFIALTVSLTAQTTTQVRTVPASFCISSEEMKLYTLINEYRKEYNLPPVPLSRSLCYVASTHVKDLITHHPDKGSCNFHSWSDKGFWKPFCYPRDENKKYSVWDKPKEICNYPGKGFEIVYWENNPVTFDSILPFWKSVDYFNAFLMNTGKWQDKKWNAIGIAIFGNYASAWFGEIPDPAGEPYVCGHPPLKKPEIVKQTTDTVKKQKPVADTLAKKPAKGKKTVKPLVKTHDSTALSKSQKLKTPDTTALSKSQKLKPAENQAVKTDTVPVKPGKTSKKEKPVSKIADTAAHVAVPVLPAHDRKYFIIISSQLTLAESKKYAEKLIKEGYPGTKILKKDNKNRISILEFNEKLKADSALRVVKKTFRDAWILK
jgi:hypothetical protein